MDPYRSIKNIKGIGPKRAAALRNAGIETVADMISTFPRTYEDRRRPVPVGELHDGQKALVEGDVTLAVKGGYGGRYNRGRQRLKLLVSDGTGTIEVVFFNAGYIKIKGGDHLFFYGKVTRSAGRLQMAHPEFFEEPEEGKTAGILPVYPLTKGITQKEMRTWQKELSDEASSITDWMPEKTIERNRLCSLGYALENIHFPKEKRKLQEARFRMIFDELTVLQTGLFAVRENIKNGGGGIAFSKDVKAEEYTSMLPYEPTGAQKRCIEEIERDLEDSRVMNRLVQGDVGSGKTAVAEAAMYKAVRSGYQAAMMAPTEILARQHYEGISESFERFGIRTGFLSGSMKAAEKRAVLEDLASGGIDVIIGTHAVIQEGVEFRNLGLVITDEQHRFGVGQRIRLKEKGDNPNILVMTATPIPRTLAVILYGDLDVSVIDEMPPGRQEIRTRNLKKEDRDRCYDFAADEVRKGRQVYVVAPLIEDSETVDSRSAVEIHRELVKRYPDMNTGLIHGAMKQDEKDRIMNGFHDGDIDILVATVVIEVGINVPNATVMIIENAERFGLAQMHQLRGRVGRGSHRSYCFLITDSTSEVAVRRGEIMQRSSDGFYIAEEDLKTRGPGEIFGTRQHGIPELGIADLARHLDILESAKKEARMILEDDPDLAKEENRGLRERVIRLFGEDFILNL